MNVLKYERQQICFEDSSPYGVHVNSSWLDITRLHNRAELSVGDIQKVAHHTRTLVTARRRKNW